MEFFHEQIHINCFCDHLAIVYCPLTFFIFGSFRYLGTMTTSPSVLCKAYIKYFILHFAKMTKIQSGT